MPSALRRRRGTRSSSSATPLYQSKLVIGALAGLLGISFFGVILLGTHFLLNSPHMQQVITQKEKQAHLLLRHETSRDDPNNNSHVQIQRDDDDPDGDPEAQIQVNRQMDLAQDEEETSREEGDSDDLASGEGENPQAALLFEDEPETTTATDADSTTTSTISHHKPPYPYMPDTLVADNHDFTTWTAPGGSRYEEYKDGDTPYDVTSSALQRQSDALARSRRVHVKRAMQHAWKSYEEHAFGGDELTPQSGKASSHWGGMGTTLVDSLDTLWLMDMKDEFWRARDWVRDKLTHDNVGKVSFFETTIRSLGGLLSAYDWSGDVVFLDKAEDLGQRLLNAFQSASGLPLGQVHLGGGNANNIGWTGGSTILAEAGTCQLEYRYLAKASGKADYADKPNRAFQVLRDMRPPNALYPYFIRSNQDKPEFANQKLTFGAMADSFYEYMLKLWLQGGRMEDMYRVMYDESMEGMHAVLLQKSTPSGLTFIADKNAGRYDTKMDHLVCFMGGLLALGAYTDPLGLESDRAQRDLKTAKALTYTCYQMYARMETGIAPEFVQFYEGKDFDVGRGAPHYLLRPETVESFFILNYLTGDPIYREWGWEVFQAIERYCKTQFAYGALSNVRDTNGKPRDSMESFFLAETLKYLYLLFDPDTEVDILHKHVFNTEAHPLRMFPAMDHQAVK